MTINSKVPRTSSGGNANIKFDYGAARAMTNMGNLQSFWSYNEDNKNMLYYRQLEHNISVTITVRPDNTGYIVVFDNELGEPYDFQSYLNKDPEHKVSLYVQHKVYMILADLSYYGIISGWSRGDYV